MLLGLTHDLKPGDTVKVTVTFRPGGSHDPRSTVR